MSDDALAIPANRAAAEAVYAYAQLNHPTARADGLPWDGVLCLCSSDLRVARHAAKLHQELGGWLCFSGGHGTGPHSGANLMGWTEPEAVIFAREATKCGVPEESILVEASATNTGENVKFSRELLASRGLEGEACGHRAEAFHGAALVGDSEAGVAEVDAVISSRLTLDECIEGSAGVPLSVLVAIMVGDLQRIRLYALPSRSFQIPQPIPREAWAAYELLVAAGFVMNLVQTEEPLKWEPSWMECEESPDAPAGSNEPVGADAAVAGGEPGD